MHNGSNFRAVCTDAHASLHRTCTVSVLPFCTELGKLSLHMRLSCAHVIATTSKSMDSDLYRRMRLHIWEWYGDKSAVDIEHTFLLPSRAVQPAAASLRTLRSAHTRAQLCCAGIVPENDDFDHEPLRPKHSSCARATALDLQGSARHGTIPVGIGGRAAMDRRNLGRTSLNSLATVSNLIRCN